MRNHRASLLYFNLKTTSVVWIYVAISVTMVAVSQCLRATLLSADSGMDAMLRISWTTIYFSIMIGWFFYSEWKPGARGSFFMPLPHGEFLLSRPVTRREAWMARGCMCYALMLAAPLLDLCLTLLKPDLRFYLFHGHDLHNEATDKLPQYLAAFPGSAVIHDPASRSDTLVAPWGYMLFATSQFLYTAIAALGLQILTLARLSPKLKGGLFLGGGVAVMLIFQFTGVMEPCFFIFTRYWFILTPAILVFIVAAQWFASKGASEMEIV
ncbi:MAG TPA: hypothetical protein VG733_16165 [Chthoniobacteraceae bacterium]|nr:hypothetical protein [Chthoniobacteraceae bacterium]